jgi:hypothetical protein
MNAQVLSLAPSRQTENGGQESSEENLTLAEVLEKYTDGPSDGVFTGGGSHPNPGPGGWGIVWVEDGGSRTSAQARPADDEQQGGCRE